MIALKSETRVKKVVLSLDKCLSWKDDNPVVEYDKDNRHCQGSEVGTLVQHVTVLRSSCLSCGAGRRRTSSEQKIVQVFNDLVYSRDITGGSGVQQARNISEMWNENLTWRGFL